MIVQEKSNKKGWEWFSFVHFGNGGYVWCNNENFLEFLVAIFLNKFIMKIYKLFKSGKRKKRKLQIQKKKIEYQRKSPIYCILSYHFLYFQR